MMRVVSPVRAAAVSAPATDFTTAPPRKRSAKRSEHADSDADATAASTTAMAEPGPTERRRFAIDCRLGYELPLPTSLVFQVHALHGRDQQVLAESLELAPAVASHVFLDPMHHHRFLRLQAPAGPLSLRYRARVEVLPRRWPDDAPELPVEALPDDVLHHLLPTRYCESDLLANAALRLFGGLPPGRARVQAIADWVFEQVEYRPGASDATTTARDVFVRRAGVCRDFAHLAMTFCRALNIPARLVAGYSKFSEPPPDFHAVFEAYLGGEWILFDPTRMAPMEDFVRIAAGRDAKDVAFSTMFGPATMTEMAPLVEPLDGETAVEGPSAPQLSQTPVPVAPAKGAAKAAVASPARRRAAERGRGSGGGASSATRAASRTTAAGAKGKTTT
jgi:transglutaminase-like putative cysteine protease